MLITLFNAVLIIFITVLSYKYFSLKESIGSEKHRSVAYAEVLGTITAKYEAYEGRHVEEMVKMALEIARAKGLDQEQIEGLFYATWLHDIGELLLPKELLKNSEKIVGENHFLLRTHPLLGELELKNRCPAFDEVPTLIRWHHEKWDGSGYPDNLKGEEIPLNARIIALVDAVSAMKSPRPYRHKSLTHKEVLKELDRQSGLQFDPELVEIFKNIYPEAGEDIA